ncbi:Abi family protein [Corynebacterium sp. sy039]|uniref:Abi family protein n=1 Tax=Corynebacterium sp. sy039 TaxID=2599641 RepID=UPI0011B62086|nr:Abi family protein [Corynebacterium sp. sy039]QDZ42460.1 Abi family protein [Corynebacterium sp. sy039]
MSKAVKPATTIVQQITLLRDRGMEVDRDLAEQWLANVSYYRLSAYWFPARKIAESGERLDSFKDGISFADAVALYEADRKLRTLIHDGLERIEVTMRTRVGEQLCVVNPIFYMDSGNFRPNFKHERWLSIVQKRIKRAAKRNESIKHYQDKYGANFPFWVLAEVLDFADISRMFDGMFASDQRAIAEDLGIHIDLDILSVNQRQKAKSSPPLARWLEQLTIIRNSCAHHSRLWNKSFTPAPTAAFRTIDAFAALPIGQSERIFGAITVMSYLLNETSPGTTWPEKVTDLLNRDFLSNPIVEKNSLGIPDDWNGTFRSFM